MDFYQIIERKVEKKGKDDYIELYPDFIVRRSKDLMVRGKSFYAIWDAENKIWSTDEYDVQRLVDAELEEYKNELKKTFSGKIAIKRMSSFSSKMWTNYRAYLNQMSDNSNQLDEALTFSNTKIKKTDYISRRLPYPLEEGHVAAYDELMSTLYDPEERAKLEWAIGSIVAGESKDIQKFIVLYGEAGSGKSTFLNIVQKLFTGYYTAFEAKALASANNGFSMEVFKSNPLVAIQHDGDLSRIEDNTKLNSIISHEEMIMNEKYKSGYGIRINCFLFMGTNKPVKITDAKSGIIRRLIDVKPSLRKIPNKRYHALMSQIDFELGAIAYHCLQVYQSMGKNAYSNYRPLEMMYNTDMFFNFIEENYYVFKEQSGITLSQAYQMYKTYCQESSLEFVMSRPRFREELKSYFKSFEHLTRIDGKQIRSYYSGFMFEKFNSSEEISEEKPCSLVLDSQISLLDDLLADCLAQYATNTEIPSKKWSDCNTVLANLNTKELHYVKVPTEHIVIDFDLKNENGEKSLDRNLDAASSWPATYAELSKGGNGVHLHYIYDGDPTKLSRVYSEGIEVKVFTGNSSLRRKFTKCNNIPIATINSGLPLKGEKPVIDFGTVQSEKSLRNQITRNLNKEIHPGTKPSICFIHKILEDAYNSGMHYDVTDMRPRILTFANNSTNQAEFCIKLVNQMKFASEESRLNSNIPYNVLSDQALIFFDVEVFPNLFVVVWKTTGGNKVTMYNPTPAEIEPLLKLLLVGFNCRRYDNHMIYACYIGYNNLQLYELSQKIINGSRNAFFGEAYNLSYTDVYDFASASNKMSLKKWEIKLGIHHQELGLPWDKPVPKELWPKVGDYCGNDVDATEATFYHLSGDWAARQILAVLSGLSVNDTTNQHSMKIVFGNERKPQDKFVYTHLDEMFPGYTFDHGISTYRGIKVGEGGYVYAEPGMHTNVAVLDVVSMHPTSIGLLNLFGPYTKNFNDLKEGRVAIKHKDYETLKTLLDGKLVPFIEAALGDNPKFSLKDVSNGLKTAINSAYGLTSASFENPFRDPRNKDNIVAKRGALFMIDLQHAVQEQGFTVAHIKTDSIKIPDATPEIIDFVFEFGKKYGYEFEHEDTFEKFCLVNDAVYIAKVGWSINPDRIGKWDATGAQFAQPYVFKTLFSHEPIVFADMCETKSVTTVLYLDMNEENEDEHNYHFIGKTGAFCPIKPGCGGGLLLREKDDKYYAATGSKGYRWLEAELVIALEKEEDIDEQYYRNLVDAAVADISKFGDFEWFIEEPIIDEPIGFNDTPPVLTPCGKKEPCAKCVANGGCSGTCSKMKGDEQHD